MGTTPEAVRPDVSGTELETAALKPAMLAWVEAIAPYGIFTTDTHLRVRSWNQWLVTHSGLTSDDVLGRPLTEVFPDIAERRLDEHFHRALDGQISVLSTALHRYLIPLRSTIRTTQGTEMLQTARIAPLVFEGRTVGTIATIEDVTQRESHALVLRRHFKLRATSQAERSRVAYRTQAIFTLLSERHR